MITITIGSSKSTISHKMDLFCNQISEDLSTDKRKKEKNQN